MGTLARNSPHALLSDWRQQEAWRFQGARTSAAGSPPAEEPPPQNEGPPRKGLLRDIGASRVMNSDAQEAECARG